MAVPTFSPRFPWKIFSRIVLFQSLMILVGLGASGISARYFFKKHFLSQIEHQLRETLTTLSHDLPADLPEEYNDSWCLIHAQETSLRLTIISTVNGTPRCDSHYPAHRMQSIFERPEIQEALTSNFGSNARFSLTSGQDMLYGALLIQNRNMIIRAGIPLQDLLETLSVFDRSLALILATIGTFLLAISLWSGRRIAFPLGRILEKARTVLGNTTQDYSKGAQAMPHLSELSELETSLEDIGRDLQEKSQSLTLERKEQATLMSAISDAILAVDFHGAPLFYNSRYMVTFQNPDLKNNHPEIWNFFQEALTQGKPLTSKAIAVGQGPSTKFFSVSVSPLSDPDGKTYGVVGVFHDVTELKLAEQMRIDFVANASHELRTPLTAIKGYSDTIVGDLEQGQPVEREFVQIISRNASRLLSLINDLLDLSSLEASDTSTLKIQKTPVNTLEITQRVVANLQGSLERKHQTIEILAQAKEVTADTTRLEQVLTNLIFNAHKYIQEGGHIKVSWLGPTENKITLCISDNGPGISEEHHQRLFERFYRVDKARARDSGGTGLGLSIVRHIMQNHGGDVRIESKLGEGTTFFCIFPA